MRRAAVVLASLTLATTACSSSSSAAGTTTLTVFASSPLSSAFEKIGQEFEQANQGVRVVFITDASAELADQIESGDTVDVFASASAAAMDSLIPTPGVNDRSDFATSELVIITPPGNPADVRSVDSLTRSGIELVMGVEGVPVGDDARRMLDLANLEHVVLTNVVSFARDDATIVATVADGEADAGIVYTSDLASAEGTVASIAIPPPINVTATYQIAAIATSPRVQLASAFIAFVVGPWGQATLRVAGFDPPPSD